MKKFKLIKTYHKPYRLFSENYVLNVGNLTPVVKNIDYIKWLEKNMDYNLSLQSTFDVMNSEFTIWKKILKNLKISYFSYLKNLHISFQHYSKTLDLLSIRDQPYHDTLEIEYENGAKYISCKTLDEFGYNDIDKYLSEYSIIVGNQYPCNILSTIDSRLNIKIDEVLKQYHNIIDNLEDDVFTVERFNRYINAGYQYWRGGPVIASIDEHEKMLDYLITFEHSFFDCKSFKNEEIFKSKDQRGIAYIGEMIYGFLIYCIVDKHKVQKEKIGYCRLLSDQNVLYSITKK